MLSAGDELIETFGIFAAVFLDARFARGMAKQVSARTAFGTNSVIFNKFRHRRLLSVEILGCKDFADLKHSTPTEP
jgi:hypothetical protein